MPKHKHHGSYRITFQYDCNFTVYADSLEEAIAIAEAKGPFALISVHAGAMNAFVAIHAYQAKDKSLDDVMELFDRAVEDYVECRKILPT